MIVGKSIIYSLWTVVSLMVGWNSMHIWPYYKHVMIYRFDMFLSITWKEVLIYIYISVCMCIYIYICCYIRTYILESTIIWYMHLNELQTTLQSLLILVSTALYLVFQVVACCVTSLTYKTWEWTRWSSSNSMLKDSLRTYVVAVYSNMHNSLICLQTNVEMKYNAIIKNKYNKE